MRKWILTLAALMVVAWGASAQAASGQKVAQAISLEGRVEARQGAGGGWKAAEVNEKFMREDALKTGRASQADLKIVPQDYLRVNEETEVEIIELVDEEVEVKNPIARLFGGKHRTRSTSRVRLLGGSIFTSVRKRSAEDQFIIDAGIAIVGVRGSSNSVRRNPQTGVVEVVQATGKSFVWAPGREERGVELEAGMTTTVEPGRDPETPSAASSPTHLATIKAITQFTSGYGLEKGAAEPGGTTGGGETEGEGPEGGDSEMEGPQM